MLFYNFNKSLLLILNIRIIFDYLNFYYLMFLLEPPCKKAFLGGFNSFLPIIYQDNLLTYKLRVDSNSIWISEPKSYLVPSVPRTVSILKSGFLKIVSLKTTVSFFSASERRYCICFRFLSLIFSSF